VSIARQIIRLPSEEAFFMQFILLVYETKGFRELPDAEKKKVEVACGAWHQELVKSGHARAAQILDPVSAAATVRHNNGHPVVTDGPFAETKEVLGGYDECKDIEQAIAIAKRFPALRAGFSNMEVRRIRKEFPMDGSAERASN
jgi:hypothetical protein